MSKVLVLVVEDDYMLAELYAQKLKIDGFDVDISHDGQDGFEKMKLEKPSLVLMDIMMPNLDGFAALKKAKKDPETKDIPIIMLTNLASASEAQKAIQAGAAGYIVKSEITPGEVVKRIKVTLAASKQKPSTEPPKL